ncbi:MAG: YVTN family beta-propeller protein [Candidatus Binatia bacterium]|jgi:YVTN family beta-propeller protein
MDRLLSMIVPSIRRKSRTRVAARIISGFAFFILAGIIGNAADAVKPAFRSAIEDQGVSVELIVDNLKRVGATDLMEGDDVSFKIKISDVTSGALTPNLSPAVWVDLRPEEGFDSSVTCIEKAKKFLSGNIFSNPEIDLNAFYVICLNEDATITVVDPLFGFGGTKLLAMIPLKSAGQDWAILGNDRRVFVTLPESNEVAILDTSAWALSGAIVQIGNPTRIVLQPDERRLWISSRADNGDGANTGVSVASVTDGNLEGFIATGRGPHDICISPDSSRVYVSNRGDNTVSVIDAANLRKLRDVPVGAAPISVSYSRASGLAHVACHGDGSISAINDSSPKPVATVQTAPGVTQIAFDAIGRYGLVVNPENDTMYVVDAARRRVIKNSDLRSGPDRVAFSDRLAYVRHRGSDEILMVPMDQFANESAPLTVIDFPGGQSPAGAFKMPSLAASIVSIPGGDGVLVANPGDQSVYYYKEGMAAPMGNFMNFRREPRAVLVVDRSLQERRTPGVYETAVRFSKPGIHDVVFLLDSPRIVHCFTLHVKASPQMEMKRNRARKARVTRLTKKLRYRMGETIPLNYALSDPVSGEARPNLKDVRALAYLAPGIWQKRLSLTPEAAGYKGEFKPPQAGIYYVYLQSPTLGLAFNNPQYTVFEVVDGPTEERPVKAP